MNSNFTTTNDKKITPTPKQMSAAGIFEEVRKSTTGALDRAKLVFLPNSPSDDNEQQRSSQQPVEQTPPDRLEELSEYCPKLTFQQVSTTNQSTLLHFVNFFMGCRHR
jgi:hypothetical protein